MGVGSGKFGAKRSAIEKDEAQDNLLFKPYLSLSFSTGLTNASQQLHHLLRTPHSDVSSENTNMYVLVYRLYLFLAVVLLTCVSPHFSIK